MTPRPQIGEVAMQNEHLVRELNKLTEMHAAGVLSNEQFAQAKARLLTPPDVSAATPPFPPGGTHGHPPPPAGPAPGYGPPGPGGAGHSMGFCPACGQQLKSAGRFCGSCGTALPHVGPSPAGGTSVGESSPGMSAVAPMPAASSGQWPGQGATAPGSAQTWRTPEVDQLLGQFKGGRDRLVGGDWPSAVIAAGTAVAVMFGYCLIGVLILVGTEAIPGIDGSSVLGFTAALTAMAVGGDVSASGGRGAISGGASIDFLPTSVTLIGFAALAFVFLRRLPTTGRSQLNDIVYQGLRTALAFVGFLLIIAFLGRVQIGLGVAEFTTGIWSTVFSGLYWLAITLVVAVVWRVPESLPPRALRWRAVVAPLAAGTAAMLVLGAAIALLAAIVLSLVFSDASGAPLIALLVIGPTILLTLIAFGLGVPVGMSGAGSVDGFGSAGQGRTVTVFDATGADGLFWLLPLIVILLVFAGAVVAAACAPTPQDAQRQGWRWGLAVGLLFALVAIHGGISGGFAASGIFGARGDVGLEFMLAVLLGLVWGAATGWLAGRLTPSLPPALINNIRQRLAPLPRGY